MILAREARQKIWPYSKNQKKTLLGKMLQCKRLGIVTHPCMSLRFLYNVMGVYVLDQCGISDTYIVQYGVTDTTLSLWFFEKMYVTKNEENFET